MAMILKNQFPIQQILALCNEIRNDYSLIGACIYGSKVYGCGDVNSPYDCLLILQDYERGIRYNYRKLGKESDISFLIVDRELFEIDVNNGKVGDFLSNRILTPYIVTMNSNYFAEKELLFKKRIIKEELENLIIEYGELSRSLLIKPEYFATARMVKRAKVFPPLGYGYSKLLNDSIAMKSIVKSFNEAIEGATVTLWDKDDTELFSVSTGSLGTITEQTVSYGYYTVATGDTLQSYSPHKLEIKAGGYKTYTKTFTLDEKIDWRIRLYRHTDVIFVDTQPALNLNPHNPQNQLYTRL